MERAIFIVLLDMLNVEGADVYTLRGAECSAALSDQCAAQVVRR